MSFSDYLYNFWLDWQRLVIRRWEYKEKHRKKERKKDKQYKVNGSTVVKRNPAEESFSPKKRRKITQTQTAKDGYIYMNESSKRHHNKNKHTQRKESKRNENNNKKRLATNYSGVKNTIFSLKIGIFLAISIVWEWVSECVYVRLCADVMLDRNRQTLINTNRIVWKVWNHINVLKPILIKKWFGQYRVKLEGLITNRRKNQIETNEIHFLCEFLVVFSCECVCVHCNSRLYRKILNLTDRHRTHVPETGFYIKINQQQKNNNQQLLYNGKRIRTA